MEVEKKWNFKDWWKDYGKIAIATTLAVVFIICVILFNYFVFVGKPTDTRGTFGDMFGVSNAIFSALAFVGIIVTIFLQSQELKDQRKELRYTRAEFNQQNETLSLQRFENTFFQLLGVHHSIVEGMEGYSYDIGLEVLHFDTNFTCNEDKVYLVKRNETIAKGRDFFNESIDILKHTVTYIGENEKTILTNPSGKIPSDLSDYYGYVYKFYESTLGHYYRNLYRIFKFIDEMEFISKKTIQDREGNKNILDTELEKQYLLENNTKRYQYTSMVRAQFSESEIFWLCFNGLSTYGEKFKPLIEKYTLLKHFNNDYLKGKLMDSPMVEDRYYRQSAFLKDQNNYIKKD